MNRKTSPATAFCDLWCRDGEHVPTCPVAESRQYGRDLVQKKGVTAADNGRRDRANRIPAQSIYTVPVEPPVDDARILEQDAFQAMVASFGLDAVMAPYLTR